MIANNLEFTEMTISEWTFSQKIVESNIITSYILLF